MRKRLLASTVVLVVVVTSQSSAASGYDAAAVQRAQLGTAVFQDPSYSPRERAVDLVSRMTLPEKAGQMISSQAAALPRLGLPAYGWWNEAAHGVAREGLGDGNPTTLVNTTSYPVDLSLGASWDPDLMYREATMISDEAREVVRDNRLDLNFYSPTINLARDPRWGRNDEAFSEDPLLTAAIAAQFVNGMEGKDSAGAMLADSAGYLKTSTTLKHYALNNSEYNRRNGTSDADDRTIREYYTAQFRETIARSSPQSIMTSYNRVNGEPTSASGYLMDELARQTFGFAGFFTSDCDSVFEIQNGHRWGPPGRGPLNNIERNAFANAAGEDLNCEEGYHDQYNYANTLPTAVSQGVQTPQGRYTEDFLDASLVRLMETRIRLGEFDDDADVPWVTQARSRVRAGSWTNSDANRAVTQTPRRLAMAREAAVKSLVLLKNDGPRVGAPSQAGGVLPLRVPESGPYRVAVVGHYANPGQLYLGNYSSQQGAAGRANHVNGYQGVRDAVRAINPDAVVDHLPGVTRDSLAQVDAASVAAAANYDAVIAYVGTDERHAREDLDRASLALPGAQADMIRQVAARNPNTVVYLETAGVVDVSSFAAAVPAILWSSFNGQRRGEALADVLLGADNPSGHLPFTWYASQSQLPAIGDYRIRPGGSAPGRTYQYFTGEPAFPFGHGLSYTTFGYDNLTVGSAEVAADGTIEVSVDVTNTGDRAGADVVQLYVTTPDAAQGAQRPVRRLRGFEKVTLDPGQTRRVTLRVDVPDLAFFDETLERYVVDPGRYGIEVSGSATDVRQRTEITVSGQATPRLSVVTAKAPTLLDTGETATPAVTVALSDDTRYGYRTEDASTALPDGATVTYRSNRPEAARVDEAGRIMAVAAGVATITIEVSYQGVTRSADVVVGVR